MEVQILNNSGFIWNAEDVKTLRLKHRILGNFVGFAPKTYHIGLPLILQPVELQLLKEKGLVRFYQVDGAKHPRDQLIEKALEYREQCYQTQIDEFKAERTEKIYSIADKIVAGKRKKMLQEEKELKKQKIAASEKEKHADDDQSVRDNLDRETIINQEIANIKPISREMQVIQTFIEDPWIEAEEKQTCKWSYPSSDILSKCRLYTFKDLWNNNYYLSEGSKFGGDFLAYCGDPVKYHAKYIVICVENKESISNENRVQDLIARCRLGTSVKKIILFSWLEEDEVKYKSLTRGSEI